MKALLRKGVSNDWLWKITPEQGTVMCEDDWILNVQKRVGARMLEWDGDEPPYVGRAAAPWTRK